ncbi:MAG: CPBP family intramembrane metalloprotease [Methanosphaera stadtmanae]|nr:CPBP family intramembrane metalloprotease [Methanosphaera stadtmanae]
MSENSKNRYIPDFITFTRELENYKWYKPILTFIVSLIIYLISLILIVYVSVKISGVNINIIESSGYESLNSYSIEGIIQVFSLVLLIPSVYIGSKITRDRSFKTYLTSRVKWNWGALLKIFLISAIIVLIVCLLGLSGNFHFNNHFTIITLIITLILVPLQCFSEELVFRGFFMQTFGSWFKIPIVAIILQSVIFMLLHPYNLLGQISILISGIIWGIIAWKTNGLETTTAIHSANNLIIFLFGGFGLLRIESNVTLIATALDIIMLLVIGLVVLYLIKRFNWFDEA